MKVPTSSGLWPMARTPTSSGNWRTTIWNISGWWMKTPRIFRRQLVYLKATAAAVFESAKLTRQPVQQLTLPGLDGQELQFQIVKAEGNGSSRQGMFSGHLVGNLDSMVSFAFEDGREAFTVLCAEGKYLSWWASHARTARSSSRRLIRTPTAWFQRTRRGLHQNRSADR